MGKKGSQKNGKNRTKGKKTEEMGKKIRIGRERKKESEGSRRK